MRRLLFGLAAGLLLAGCGYRVPLSLSYIPAVTDTAAYDGVRKEYRELAALIDKDTGLKPTAGNTVTLLPDGRQKWALMKKDLTGAREAVYIDHYIFRSDSIGTVVSGILKQKARDGADVRVILDRAGNERRQIRKLSALREAGANLGVFHFQGLFPGGLFPKLATHRDHRKIIVLDGKTGYLGGRNINDDNYFQWRDADLRVTGPAVSDLTEVFLKNQRKVAPEWGSACEATDLEEAACADRIPDASQFRDATVQIVPEIPTDRRLPIRNGFEWAIRHAQHYFWFYNPYAPPPSSTLRALKEAAARGVDIRWIAPAENDVAVEKWMGESLYRELLKAGIRIYEWQGQVLHAKEFVSDDYLLAIGSANMDNLSFFLNYEVEALVYDEAAARCAADTFRADLSAHCREISLDEVRRWCLLRRFRNWLTRLIGGAIG